MRAPATDNSESTNNFEQIYQAALAQDPKQLPDTCIDEFERGHDGMSAAAKLASEGKKTAANWLLQQGANINWVAQGAAIGGHEAFARQLLQEGANINWVAHGAACGGHEAWARQLVQEGADINEVAYGAAHGGARSLGQAITARRRRY